jgi:hypothetical protein
MASYFIKDSVFYLRLASAAISQNCPVPYTQACQHLGHKTCKAAIYLLLYIEVTVMQINFLYTLLHEPDGRG